MTQKQTTEHTRRSARTRRKTARTKRKKRAKGRWLTAATSDRYDLYERSVQDGIAECDLIDQVWKECRGRKAHFIREDFCGTFFVCREWVKRRRNNIAIGVDLDPVPLEWGRTRAARRLKPHELKRITLLQDDVRTVRTRPVDSVLAMNFSYYIFKTREGLRDYFKSVRASLVKDGLFLLDAYGGSDSFAEMKEPRDFDGFTYIWDQNRYNPITGDVINHIHFEFPDGTKMKKAFSYDWRLWTLPELREVLLEAGFKKALVYWEGTDEESGEGNGEWTASEVGEAFPGWIAYLVGQK